MKASDLEVGRNISFLFKGPYGHGKTLAAASLALHGSIYLAYWDKNRPVELVHYFKRFGDKGKKILENIEYDVYGSHNANKYLNKLIDLNSDCRHFAVITDSVTNMTSGAVNWSLGYRDPKGPKKDKVNKEAIATIPDFDEYKVETGLITQALDILRTLPTNVIWIAHPLPQTKIEGSGNSMKVSKAISIVTYGSKVAGMIPGSFTEIYHFSKKYSWNTETGSGTDRYTVDLRGVGDDFGKTAIFDPDIKELDITDKLFYEVWKEALDKQNKIVETKPDFANPFEATATQEQPTTPTQNRWK